MLSESGDVFKQETQELPVQPQEQTREKSEGLLERLKGYGQAIKERVASLFSRRQETEKIMRSVDGEAVFTDEELAQLDDAELRAKFTEQSSQELFAEVSPEGHEKRDIMKSDVLRIMESDPKRYSKKGMPIENPFGDGGDPLLNISLDATRGGSQDEQGMWTFDDWNATPGGAKGRGLYADYEADKLGGIKEVYQKEKTRELGEEGGIEATEKLETFLREQAIDSLNLRIAKEERPDIKIALEDQKHRVEQYHTQEQKKRLEKMVERRVRRIREGGKSVVV